MEFYVKLQHLRKSQGLTQEELADALFVSRTAVSKWESGRGYPSIDSLKVISEFFSVTIDELLSCEKLLNIAEKEQKAGIQALCCLWFGIVDILFFILAVLPLYPFEVGGYVYSVNLFAYTENGGQNFLFYWILVSAAFVLGVIKTVVSLRGAEKRGWTVIVISLALNIITVLFFALTRVVYGVMLAFLLFVIKGIILFKYIKT